MNEHAGEPKTSGMAIGSLICSILGFTCLVPGPVGIVLGFMAMSRIKKSGGELGGHGLALAGTILGFAGTAFATVVYGLVIAITVPSLANARNAAMMTSSKANMKQIGLAMLQYETENRRKPASLEELYETDLLPDPQVFRIKGKENPEPGFSDYVYLPLPGSDPAKQNWRANRIIVVETPGGPSTRMGRINCLYADGHVQALNIPAEEQQAFVDALKANKGAILDKYHAQGGYSNGQD